jgi:glycosyltransferase involved in cell wall biosynthesis
VITELPKLLLIAQTIPQTIYAGEILLYRLLKDYPPDKLLIIGPPAHPDAALLRCRYETIKVPLERFERSRFTRFVMSLRSSGVFPQINLRAIRERLGQFKPQIVLSVMQSQAYYGTAFRFAKSAGLPLVIIVHDIPEVFEPVYPWAKGIQNRKNTEVYKYARKRLCVSPEMKNYLERVYGETGTVLYPNRSDELVPRPLLHASNLKHPDFLTVGYAGSLAYGYGSQLKRMIPAFRVANARLRLYTEGNLGVEAQDVITSCGRMKLPEMTWSKIKEECDALILPYCWSEDGHQDLYQVHFPSKLPEYLALGMPLIVVGPKYATGVRWALQNPDAALVTTENCQSAWIKMLVLLKESVSLRNQLSEQALKAGEYFCPLRIRSQFLEHLTDVVA